MSNVLINDYSGDWEKTVRPHCSKVATALQAFVSFWNRSPPSCEKSTFAVVDNQVKTGCAERA